jgi:methylamine utilization protein MauJ
VARRDEWVVVAVEPAVEWPQGSEVTASFRGREMIIRPETAEVWADVSMLREPNETDFAAYTLVQRFLSAMAWKRRAALRVEGTTGGTDRIRIGGRRPVQGSIVLPGYHLAGLVEHPTPEQELALALYREAIGIPDNTYRFLALFRILNISLQKPEHQIQWIDGQLATVPYPARPRAEALAGEVVPRPYSSVGAYLYAEGRGALAHAFAPPFVDPDLMDDTYRINRDLILVEALVERYMVGALNLPDD